MENKKMGIYGVHNTTADKWYIGSSINIELRINSHIKAIKDKSGVFESFDDGDDFSYKILKTVANVDSLELWENYYIGLYNSIEKGYNSVLAARKPAIHTSQYKIDESEISIMDDEDLCDLLKINSDDELAAIKCKIPHIKITGSIKRYEKKEVVNFLLKESALSRYYSNINSDLDKDV